MTEWTGLSKERKKKFTFSPFTITRAGCGLYHSIVVGKRREAPQLYGWGRNYNNVLALGPDVPERHYPTPIPYFSKNHVFQVACGLNHTMILIKSVNHSGGRVYSCGLGNNGRLGFFKTDKSIETEEHDSWFTYKPIRVGFPNKEKIIRISCGSDHSLAISQHGELFAWGVGQYGNLGTGNTKDVTCPVQITVGNNKSFVVHCSAGGKHSLACTNDGRCYSWGHPGNGRLGLGHLRSVIVPTLIEASCDREIVFVSAGEAHSASIDKVGIVYTWGAGSYGRLGHGDDTDMHIPRKIESFGGQSIVQVACGTFHTMAVSRDGKLFSWGSSLAIGLVSEGENSSVLIPKAVNHSGLISVCNIAVGTYHTIALTQLGDVFCWGVGGQSRLGHGDDANQPFPKHVAHLRNKAYLDDLKEWFLDDLQKSKNTHPLYLEAMNSKKIQTISCGEAHTMVLLIQGDVWVWGSNSYGQLGLGDALLEEIVYEPNLLEAFKDPIRRIACGKYHSLASNIRGELYVWGSGDCGQLGLGRVVDASVPTGVLHMTCVFDVFGGEDYSACLSSPNSNTIEDNFSNNMQIFTEAGDLWTWGSCETGKLGHEGFSSGSCLSPKKVKLSVPISMVSCGVNHMLACSPDGKVFAWGAGYYGRLGIGSSANSSIPVEVSLPDDIVIVSVQAGAFHSLGLTSDGLIYAWGRGEALCSNENYLLPQLFTKLDSQEGLPQCKMIVVCNNHTLAVMCSGQVWVWGDNKNYQLCCENKNSSFITSPEVLHNLPNAVDFIATGPNHTIANLCTNEVYAWGNNNSGCLGIGLTKKKYFFHPEAVLSNWRSVAGPKKTLQSLPPIDNMALASYANSSLHGQGTNSVHTMCNVENTITFIDPFVAETMSFIESLDFSKDSSLLSRAQKLLKKEPHFCTSQELALREDDLIKILGHHFSTILKISEQEKMMCSMEYFVKRKLTRVLINLPCETSKGLVKNSMQTPTFMIQKLPIIQQLMNYLVLQPSYLVYLSRCIKQDFERDILIKIVKQVYWNIEDRHINAVFLSLCAAICTEEVNVAPDLLRLFCSENSNFVQLASAYALKTCYNSDFGRFFVDPSFEGSLAEALDQLNDTCLVMDEQMLTEFVPECNNQQEKIKILFQRSLDGIYSVLSTLSSLLTLPLGISALMKHAYNVIVDRNFSFDAYSGRRAQQQYSLYYPLVRLLLQGIVCRFFIEPFEFNQMYCLQKFQSKFAEVNFRTLSVFINSAFQNNLCEFTYNHLFREIFQSIYLKSVTILIQTLSFTVDEYIRAENTLSLFLMHFTRSPYTIILRNDILANFMNLLKRYEAHLQLSVYDPVSELLKEISHDSTQVFDKEMIKILEENTYHHNIVINRRFLLTEGNVVFDGLTGVPVPQKLAPRQQAATRDGYTVMSLVHRYVPSDPLDPRSVIENSLKATPTISAQCWSKLGEEFFVLQEFYTRQQPPDFMTAQMLGKAAKHCEDFDDQAVSLVEICKWMAEGIKKRYRHHMYLTLVQNHEDVISETERRFRMETQEYTAGLQETSQYINTLYIEPEMRERLQKSNITPFIDSLRVLCSPESADEENSSPSVTLGLHELLQFMKKGWTIQLFQVLNGNNTELDHFEITDNELTNLTNLPPFSTKCFGKKVLIFQVANLLNFLMHISVKSSKTKFLKT
ncbi:uncharacterized protein LOC128883402 isoform X2 [Hylaeus volcanicus]|uniref:uncharacterized protein LOC128883402 isoform X2 n=1 Tax=Hylaeus volcanicus TaxID=313075 RepID=UPI0023B785CA|nr:uncharacterized protein LOC128883402 isoform X2 [Hylaeus volcanicus]